MCYGRTDFWPSSEDSAVTVTLLNSPENNVRLHSIGSELARGNESKHQSKRTTDTLLFGPAHRVDTIAVEVTITNPGEAVSVGVMLTDPDSRLTTTAPFLITLRSVQEE